jgi:hypothetical protein
MVDTADLNFPTNDEDLGVVLNALKTFPVADGPRRMKLGGSSSTKQQVLL